jgi:site-specific recombinase XerD
VYAYAFHDVDMLDAQDWVDQVLAGSDETMDARRLWARFHDHLVRHRRSKYTISGYRKSLHAFWQFIEPKQPLHPRVDDRDLEKFLNQRPHAPAKHPVLSESTRHTYARRVCGFYQWALDEGLTSRNRMARFIAPPMPDAVPRALVSADLAMLLDHLEHVPDPRIRIMGWLAYFAALRVGEISRLQVQHIHLRDDPPWMLVHRKARRGKGHPQEPIPIKPELADVLAGWLAKMPRTGPLLPDLRQPTRGISPDRVSRLLGRTMRQAGLEDTAHALRHSWATDTLAAGHGLNVRAVSHVLGHVRIDTTEATYVRSYREDAVEAVRLTPDPRTR